MNKNYCIVVLFMFLAMLPKFAFAEDEECLLCDAAIGVGVAVCEQFVMCKMFMVLIVITSLFIGAIGCICGGPNTRREIWNSVPSTRRSLAAGAGYGIGRAIVG